MHELTHSGTYRTISIELDRKSCQYHILATVLLLLSIKWQMKGDLIEPLLNCLVWLAQIPRVKINESHLPELCCNLPFNSHKLRLFKRNSSFEYISFIQNKQMANAMDMFEIKGFGVLFILSISSTSSSFYVTQR